jgi:4-hydroxybenzoyl-CoA thioesterase
LNRFRVEKQVRFAHCDPAGIIFYPQYFVLLHEVKEDWFRDGLSYDYANLITGERFGLPIVRLEADFAAPSRLGEFLDCSLRVAKLGGASLHLDYEVRHGDGLRMKAHTVVVMTSLASHRPVPIHESLRAAIGRFMEGS